MLNKGVNLRVPLNEGVNLRVKYVQCLWTRQSSHQCRVYCESLQLSSFWWHAPKKSGNHARPLHCSIQLQEQLLAFAAVHTNPQFCARKYCPLPSSTHYGAEQVFGPYTICSTHGHNLSHCFESCRGLPHDTTLRAPRLFSSWKQYCLQWQEDCRQYLILVQVWCSSPCTQSKTWYRQKTIYGFRCDERLETKVEESTRLACTLLCAEPEHLKWNGCDNVFSFNFTTLVLVTDTRIMYVSRGKYERLSRLISLETLNWKSKGTHNGVRKQPDNTGEEASNQQTI